MKPQPTDDDNANELETKDDDVQPVDEEQTQNQSNDIKEDADITQNDPPKQENQGGTDDIPVSPTQDNSMLTSRFGFGSHQSVPNESIGPTSIDNQPINPETAQPELTERKEKTDRPKATEKERKKVSDNSKQTGKKSKENQQIHGNSINENVAQSASTEDAKEQLNSVCNALTRYTKTITNALCDKDYDCLPVKIGELQVWYKECVIDKFGAVMGFLGLGVKPITATELNEITKIIGANTRDGGIKSLVLKRKHPTASYLLPFLKGETAILVRKN